MRLSYITDGQYLVQASTDEFTTVSFYEDDLHSPARMPVFRKGMMSGVEDGLGGIWEQVDDRGVVVGCC